MNEPDRIALTGLRAIGRHGVLPQERATGQEFIADAVLFLDTRAAAAADDLTLTVDYADLAARIARIISGEPVALIETLAQRLADIGALAHDGAPFPVLVGSSRKRFIGRLLAAKDGTPRAFADSDDATIALSALAATAGAWCVRVHAVPGNADAVRVAARLQQEHFG